MIRFLILTSLCLLLVSGSVLAQQQDRPNNPFGAHLIIDNLGERGRAQLSWARHLVGEHGYIKSFFFNIDRTYTGAPQGWQDFVAECYNLNLIPVIRLGGYMEGGNWIKPYRDPDGSYSTMAEVFKNVVNDLPRSDKYPLYVEIWNEPNLTVEWSGEVNLKEYAQFFVEVSNAIRSIGDDRIKILNGAFALSPSATEECILAHPDFINAFDVWGSHPYPANIPPDYTITDGTAEHENAALDGYIREVEVLEKYGRKDVQVMILETGYPLGLGVHEDYPAIDEYNRADYMMRAFRDLYPRLPEVIAVFPFLFSDPGWTAFNWVPIDSGTDENGLPTKPTPMYEAVRALAKPTDSTGAISGTIRDKQFETRLQGATIYCEQINSQFTSDPMGNFYFPRLEPGSYTLRVESAGFASENMTFTVEAGKNTVADFYLQPSETGSINGVVIDGMTGAPLADVDVSLDPGDQSVTTSADGAFSFSDLPPIAYDVTASRDGFTTHILAGLRVRAGQQSEPIMKIAEDPAPPVNNMAGNPSFEQIADPDATPWRALRWENLIPGDFTVTEEESRTGHRSQQLKATPGQQTALRQITHYSTMQPGATYAIKVWMKTKGLQAGGNGGAWVSMAFTNNAGAFLKEISMEDKVRGDSDWQLVELQGVAPQGAERFSLNLHIQGNSGSAFFDDAFIGKID